MDKLYNQCWFWLMLIFCVLAIAVIILVCMVFPPVEALVLSNEFWTFIGSVATAIALFVSIFTFRSEKGRERRRATLADFPALRNKYKELGRKVSHMRRAEKNHFLKCYLSEMERFAVGVNEKAYDIHLIDRMSGGMLIEQYENLTRSFIRKRRKRNTSTVIPSENLYCEYEAMIKQLYKLRGYQ